MNESIIPKLTCLNLDLVYELFPLLHSVLALVHGVIPGPGRRLQFEETDISECQFASPSLER